MKKNGKDNHNILLPAPLPYLIRKYFIPCSLAEKNICVNSFPIPLYRKEKGVGRSFLPHPALEMYILKSITRKQIKYYAAWRNFMLLFHKIIKKGA